MLNNKKCANVLGSKNSTQVNLSKIKGGCTQNPITGEWLCVCPEIQEERQGGVHGNLVICPMPDFIAEPE
jgi:hypothetical protein